MIIKLAFLKIAILTIFGEAVAKASVLGPRTLLVFEITSYARVTRAQEAARTPFSPFLSAQAVAVGQRVGCLAPEIPLGLEL
jgi:hypothetical protein